MKYTPILAMLIFASASCFAQKDSTNLTGTWRSVLDKDKPGFTFTKDGFVYFVRGNEKWGGPPTDEETPGKMFYKYKVGRIKGFFTIDITAIKIVNKKLVEVKENNGKGIFIYLKDGRIRMGLPPPGNARPVKLIRGALGRRKIRIFG